MLTLKWRKHSENQIQLNWGLSQCVILMMESHSVVSQAVAFSYCITCKTFVWVYRTSFEHHLDLSVLKKKSENCNFDKTLKFFFCAEDNLYQVQKSGAAVVKNCDIIGGKKGNFSEGGSFLFTCQWFILHI